MEQISYRQRVDAFIANPIIHHSILGAIANGSIAAGKIANQLRRSVSNIEPALSD